LLPPQIVPQPFQPGQYAPQTYSATGTGAPLQTAPSKPRRKSRARGCLLSFVITLLILVALIIGGWNFVARPYLHSLAADQMGKALDDSMNQINPALILLAPPAIALPVNENIITQNLILPTSSNFSMQNFHLTISPTNITVSFDVQAAFLGFSTTIVTVPQVVDGGVVVKDMTVSGPITLIMTSDEMKAEVNSYLAKLKTRMKRSIASLTLQDHQLLVTLGPYASLF
jgi:hypothetical protein